MKTIVGQYECVHSSGVGLDYFTSRIDKLTLYPDGRFTLTIQSHSRATNAAKSLLKGQQANVNAPEVKREGRYTHNENTLDLAFEDGGFEPCQISWNSDGLQVGPNFFKKVSDSTSLPPVHRLKQDMDDIAKGLKIAGSIGSFAMKAAKTIQNTVQPTQGTPPTTATPNGPASSQQAAPAYTQAGPATPPPYSQPGASPNAAPASQEKLIFCEQCGAESRPGKRFCNKCGARFS